MAKFFIVDDEPILHETYRDILELKGHEVIDEAFNGNECLTKMTRLNPLPDIIILDHRMPSKNGLDTTKELIPKFDT